MGHIFRCMAIANYMQSRFNTPVLFIVNDDEVVKSVMQDNNFGFEILDGNCLHEPELKGILIRIHSSEKLVALVDIKMDISSEIQLLQRRNIPVILMDNVTPVRFVADMNIYPVAHFDSSSLDWNGYCGKIVGGREWVPVAEPFLRLSRCLLPVNERKNILVTMGGADPNRITFQVMDALHDFDPAVCIQVVLGFAFSFKEEVYCKNRTLGNRFELIENTSRMAELMAGAGLAITALGTSIYELACMKVPTLVISNFKKDNLDESKLKQFESIVPLGYYKDLSSERLRQFANSLWKDTVKRLNMSECGGKVSDGRGTKRICLEIQRLQMG